MMDIGQKLPNFSLPTQTGSICTHKDLLQGVTVLYFYPKDDTPGCTKEACDFTADVGKFKKYGARVYGVSPDSPAKHQAFIAKHKLKLTLLADEKKQFCAACGVIREKNMYGKKFMGVVRTTFILDEQNKVVHVFNNVKVTGHTQQVLKKLAALTAVQPT